MKRGYFQKVSTETGQLATLNWYVAVKRLLPIAVKQHRFLRDTHSVSAGNSKGHGEQEYVESVIPNKPGCGCHGALIT